MLSTSLFFFIKNLSVVIKYSQPHLIAQARCNASNILIPIISNFCPSSCISLEKLQKTVEISFQIWILLL
jgi:hypothetical protein